MPEKRVDIALTYIYGVGRKNVVRILKQAEIDSGKRVKDLSEVEVNRIQKVVDAIKVSGDLRAEVAANIKRLKDIKSYRGIRHLKHLPVRGQRTKTNSRTVRGNVRKTMTSGRRKETKT